MGPCLPDGRYVVDRATATATPVGNRSITGISRDGKLALGIGDGSLTPGGTPGRADLYLRDVSNHNTVRLIHDATGGDQNADITDAVLSEDAHGVAFMSDASDLVGDDTNGVADVFVWPARAPAGSP